MAFGDVRVADRAEWLVERIVQTGSVVLRKAGGSRAGEVAIQRFLSSPYVTVDALLGTAADRTARASRGRRILAVQDTSEINFARRDKRRGDFGVGANGNTPAFFVHPLLAVDVEDEAVIGLVDAMIWTRATSKHPPRGNRPFAEKESERWLLGARSAASALSEASQVIVVADRESDLYPLFADKPPGIDLLVRATQDRKLDDGSLLFDAEGRGEVLATSVVRVAPKRPGEKERSAKVQLRARTVTIVRPVRCTDKTLPDAIVLNLVEAREVDAPKGKEPLNWKLLTTLNADTAEKVCEAVKLYRLRWRIEQTFRTLKGEGLALEDSQVSQVEHMFNLAAAALIAAVRTIQLVDARDGSRQPLNVVLDETFTPALEHICAALEGVTQRQKNPHPVGSLAFLAWITARLGGWNCYGKPPGPKTMHNGWSELAAMLAGYAIAQGQNP